MQRFRSQPETDAAVASTQDRLVALDDVRQRIQDLLMLAQKIDDGNATAAEQRQGLVLALRGVARLARYLT